MYIDRKCKITFICNGASIYSEEGRLTDNELYPPLSERGQEEIEKICDFLKRRGVKNDKIYTSPSVRSVQSAAMISKLFKQDYEILEDLHTRKYGSFNGLTFEQILKNQPDAIVKLVLNPDVPVPDDAESITKFIHRIKNIIDNIIEDNIGNRIIIVTHRDIIKAAICSALNIPDATLHRIYIKSGSVTQISYYDRWASLVYCDYSPL